MDNQLFRASHKVYVLKYHIVLVCKYRKDIFLDTRIVESFKKVLAEISKRYNIIYETGGFDEYHLHVLAQGVPRYSPSKFQAVSRDQRRIVGRFH